MPHPQDQYTDELHDFDEIQGCNRLTETGSGENVRANYVVTTGAQVPYTLRTPIHGHNTDSPVLSIYDHNPTLSSLPPRNNSLTYSSPNSRRNLRRNPQREDWLPNQQHTLPDAFPPAYYSFFRNCWQRRCFFNSEAFHSDSSQMSTNVSSHAISPASLVDRGWETPRSYPGDRTQDTLRLETSDGHARALEQWYVKPHNIPFTSREEMEQASRAHEETLQQADNSSQNWRNQDIGAPSVRSSPYSLLEYDFPSPSNFVPNTGETTGPAFSFSTSGPLSLFPITSGSSNLMASRNPDPETRMASSRGGMNSQPHSLDLTELDGSNSSQGDSTGPNPKTIWQCTFSHCFHCSKNRYEWERHENTHVPGAWICMPENTPRLGDFCGICGATDIDASHFKSHSKLQSCINKSHTRRAFPRKDRLRDHIRRVHHTKHGAPTDSSPEWAHSMAWLDEWKREPDMSTISPQALWCGFCKRTFDTWTERLDDVGFHLQQGDNMDSWKEIS